MTKFELVGPAQLQVVSELLVAPAVQQPTDAGEGNAVPTNLTVGTIYTFKKQYDEIREHTHLNEGTDHLIIVLEGSLAYQTRDEKVDLPRGAIHRAPLLIPHRLIALTEPTGNRPAAVCLNIPVAKFDVKTTQAHITTVGKHLEALSAQLEAAAKHVRSVAPKKFWQ